MESSTITNGHNRSETEYTVVDHNGISGLPVVASPQGSSFTQPILSGSLAPSIIPPEHPFRTLVLCFDGTGDQFDSDNSNIVEFFSMLPKADRTKQMVYYQYVELGILLCKLFDTRRAGIGTYTSPQVATPFMSKISKVRHNVKLQLHPPICLSVARRSDSVELACTCHGFVPLYQPPLCGLHVSRRIRVLNAELSALAPIAISAPI